MTDIEPTQLELTLRGTRISQDADGRVCLNDIWKAAGGEKNKRPNDWSRLSTTIDRIKRVAALITGKSRNYSEAEQAALRAARGAKGGTYADVRLALDYAEYLDPTLAIEVKEVFLRYKAADPSLADEVMERADGAANEWMAKRSMARATRLNYTDTLKAHGIANGREYAECTNATYRGLYGRSAGQLKHDRQLSRSQSLRDSMSLKELATISFTEALASDRIEEEQSQGFSECHGVTSKVAKSVKGLLDADQRDRRPRIEG